MDDTWIEPQTEGHEEELQEDDLFVHYRFHADKGQALLRIDKFLFHKLEKTSRNRIQKAADLGCIQVNGKPVKSNYRVKPFDEICIVFAQPPHDNTLKPEELDLNILYEDDAILVLNKPAGMVVHPGHGNYSGTLVNGLAWHFEQLPKPKSAFANPDDELRPGLVHRLDKDTSGVMVIAKTESSMTVMAKKFFDRNIERKYVALVWGDVKEDTGRIDVHIGRDPRDRMAFTVFPEGDQGKNAVTNYEVIERFRYVTLVACKLETGRTHQIRVHMRHIGHPLFNDPRYGGDRVLRGMNTSRYKQFIQNCFQLIPGQALHAQVLGFAHPETGKEMYFETPPPQGFQEILEKWRIAAWKINEQSEI